MRGAGDLVPADELLEAGAQRTADAPGVLLQPLLLEDVQDRQADLARDGAAAHGGEESALPLQRVGDRGGRDHRGDRVPVAGRLRDRDDVRHHALLLEAPEMRAQAPVADLHLVGDADAAGSAHVRVGRLQVAVGQHDAAGVAVQRLADERRGRAADGRELIDRVAHRLGVEHPRIGPVRAVGAAVGVGREHRVHALGLRQRAQRVVDGARRHLVGRGRPAVVGVADAEHVAPARRRAREAQREVVGLRSGRDEEHPLERRPAASAASRSAKAVMLS